MEKSQLLLRTAVVGRLRCVFAALREMQDAPVPFLQLENGSQRLQKCIARLMRRGLKQGWTVMVRQDPEDDAVRTYLEESKRERYV